MNVPLERIRSTSAYTADGENPAGKEPSTLGSGTILAEKTGLSAVAGITVCFAQNIEGDRSLTVSSYTATNRYEESASEVTVNQQSS